MHEARHAPSPTRLKQARLRGDIARSAQLIAAAQVAAMVVLLVWLAPPLASGLLEWTVGWWRDAAMTSRHPATSGADLRAALGGLFWPVAGVVFALLAGNWIVTVLASMMQSGWRPVRRSFRDSVVLRPGAGWRSLLTGQHLWTIVAQALTLLILVAAGIAMCFQGRLDLLLQSDAAHPGGLLRDLLSLTCKAGGWIALLMLGTGLLDWMIQRRIWYRRQMMTDEEVREEARQDSGPRARSGFTLSGASAVDGIQDVHTGH